MKITSEKHLQLQPLSVKLCAIVGVVATDRGTHSLGTSIHSVGTNNLAIACRDEQSSHILSGDHRDSYRLRGTKLVVACPIGLAFIALVCRG